MQDISNNYLTVQGWMIQDLKLSGNSLLVFALIFGFCQNDKGIFYGSQQYIADWLNCSKITVFRILEELLNKGLIQKRKSANAMTNEYRINTYNVNKLIQAGRQERAEAEKNKKEAEEQDAEVGWIGRKNEEPETEKECLILTPTEEPKAEVLDKAKQLRLENWQAYQQAYQQRYGVEPLRNAKINAQIKTFCELVGEDAPKIAGFYCFHSHKWYILKGHDFGTLLANAQAVARDYYSGVETTSKVAEWSEDVSNVRSVAEEAKRLLREKWAKERSEK